MDGLLTKQREERDALSLEKMNYSIIIFYWKDGDGERYWAMIVRRYADGTADVVFQDGVEQERTETGPICGRGLSPLKLPPCRPLPPTPRVQNLTNVEVPSCISVAGALRPAD